MNALAKQLEARGLLAPGVLASAIGEAQAQREPLILHLVASGRLAAGPAANCAMQVFRHPLLDLDAFDLDSVPDALLEERTLQRNGLLPLWRRGERVFVAVADPEDLPPAGEIDTQAGMQLAPVLVEADKLKSALAQLRLSGRAPNPAVALQDGLETLDADSLSIAAEVDEPEDALQASAAEEAPIVRFVNRVLLDAVAQGASDIHFEPFEASYRIRFRTDGVLAEAVKPPKRLGRRLAARLKVMAQLNIAERRVPQDGRIKIRLSQSRNLDLRVNTLPTLWGEKVVLRILDPASAQLGIDALGFEEGQKALFAEALTRPEGMILVTGPTGSGKTVTLYTGLNLLNKPERNIATAEDPVEINLDGINQVHVNPRVGLNFATALRAFLRQDPDVLMVGEIRDLETAEIAVKAAQTGHLVLSTLHTNSAAQTLTRLRNIGVASFNLASSVVLIIAQRLVRRLCPNCRTPQKATSDSLLRQGFSPELVEAGGVQLQQANPAGCPACKNGYKGRVGVYEVVKITPQITQLIMQDGDAVRLARQARQQGFPSLRAACLGKAAAGVTSLVEVNRVSHMGDV